MGRRIVPFKEERLKKCPTSSRQSKTLASRPATPSTVRFYLSRDIGLKKKDRLIVSAQLRAVKHRKKRTIRLMTALPEDVHPAASDPKM